MLTSYEAPELTEHRNGALQSAAWLRFRSCMFLVASCKRTRDST